MALFTEKFGIKEVADVGFYKVGTVSVGDNGIVTATENPVLTFDTLKVSTLEMTAEQAEARGGKGNAPLIIWDYGREVNVTLEDAVLSMGCLEAMFGDTSGDNVITINANKFPGVYAVVGQTYARDINGVDHLFTFYIPKAKIQSENTITMEAEGDPTVFNMSLRVLRGNEDGDMVKFILQETPENGTAEISLPKTDSKTLYNVTFVDAEGKVTQYQLPAGSKVTAPKNTTGKKWNPEVATTTEAAHALYTEVNNA